MNNENNNQQNGQTGDTQDRNKKIMRGVGVVLIIVVIAALASGKWTKTGTKDATDGAVVTQEMPEGCKPGFLFSETSGKPCPTPADMTAVTTDTEAAATSPSGYDEAVRMYAGKVVLFDAACKTLPEAPTFAAGTRVLVANNSSKTQTLSLGGRTEALDAYHYFTVALKTPGELTAQCNGAAAATVTVK